MSLRSQFCSAFFDAYSIAKGSKLPQIRRFLAKSQSWSASEIRAYQDDALRQLIVFSYEHVPYYRRVMAERRLSPADIRSVGDLHRLPVLTKELLRKNWPELQADVPRRGAYQRHTGGSTGMPTMITNDALNGDWENAAYWRGMEWMGYRMGDPIAVLFGGSLGDKKASLRKKLSRAVLGEVFMPAFEVRADNLDDYINAMRQGKVRFLRGYASALFILARLMRERGVSLPLDGVSSTAETLLDFQREAIESVFKCRVFNQFGGCELNSVAFEKKGCRAFHICDELAVMESLKGDAADPGEMGALTMTVLHNYSMPLIRYQNWDVISLEGGVCSCGMEGGRIRRMYGRSNDMLMSDTGALVSGAFIPSVFLTSQSILEMQIVQNTRNKVLIRLVKGPGFAPVHLDEKIAILHKYLGNVTVDVEYASSIPRTPSGKLKTVVSDFGSALLWK